jgi:hypothetical protein
MDAGGSFSRGEGGRENVTPTKADGIRTHLFDARDDFERRGGPRFAPPGSSTLNHIGGKA